MDERRWPVLRDSIPYWIGLLLVTSTTVVDAIFISYLRVDAVAGFAFTIPLTTGIYGLLYGLGMGVSAGVARAHGERRPEVALRYGLAGLAAAIIVAAVLTSCRGALPELLGAMNARGPSAERAAEYLTVWLWALVPSAPAFAVGAFFRGERKPSVPFEIMVVAALVNLVLNPLLVFGLGPVPRLEMAGAALATSTGFICASIFALVRFLRAARHGGRNAGPWLPYVPEVFRLGGPAALQQVLVPVGLGVVTAALARQDAMGAAAQGVVGRFERLAMIFPVAVAAAAAPYISFNTGRLDVRAIRSVTRQALVIVLGYVASVGLCAGAACLWQLSSQEVPGTYRYYLAVAATASVVVSVPTAVQILTTAALTAMGRATASFAISLLHNGLLLPVMSFGGGQVGGVVGVLSGACLAGVVACAVSVAVLARELEAGRRRGAVSPGVGVAA